MVSWRTSLGAPGLPDQREDVIAEANPHKAKALFRLAIEELRVNSRGEILPTSRVIMPAVPQSPKKWAGLDSNQRPWD